jgi:ATP-binding cassette, subfamily F, member 3
MPIVVAREISKSFGAQDVLHEISFEINAGERTALVGPNGEGKSTILRLIAGLESPSGGQITTARGLKMGYLPQQPPAPTGETLYGSMLPIFAELKARQAQLQQLEHAMSDAARRDEALEQYGRLQAEFELAGGYTYETEIQQVLKGIGFTAEDFDRPLQILSGGQLTRAYLARLLLQKPELLLLDEPTNHLDLRATEWLEGHLLEWKGSLVIVAHDRYFLDRVTTKVWDLAFGVLETYPGNYSRYVEQKAERLEQRRLEYEAQQTTIQRTEAFIRRYRAGQRAKEARGRLKKLGHLKLLERPQEKDTLRLKLTSSGRSGDLVLRTRDLRVGFRARDGVPAKALLDCPELLLRRLERAALIGPNGCGKTTFLRTILGQLPPLSGALKVGESVKIGYFSQTHEDLNLERSAFEEILSVKNLPISQARKLLSRFLFYGDDVFKPLANLSGGERSRVALAKLTLAGANFLVLDEPTNHLDIASREVLEEVLLDFEGTLLFVSHDRYLVDALATQIWAVEEGRLRVYEGNYTEYLEQQREEQEVRPSVGARPRGNDDARGRDERAEMKRREAAARKQVEEVNEVEQSIASLEQQLSYLSRRLSAASERQQLDQVRELGVEYSRMESELNRLMARWVELSAERDPS